MDSNDVEILKNITYIQSQIACFNGELEAMKAANVHADQLDHIERSHSPEDFRDLAGRYGIEINQVCETLAGQ